MSQMDRVAKLPDFFAAQALALASSPALAPAPALASVSIKC